MCQIERLENREENGGNTPDRYRARATWNSIKMHIYGFLQSTKGPNSPFHFEDGGYEIDSATLPKEPFSMIFNIQFLIILPFYPMGISRFIYTSYLTILTKGTIKGY